VESQEQLPPSRVIVLWTGLFEGSLGFLAILVGWLFGCPPARLVRWEIAAVGLGAAASLLPLLTVLLCMRFPLRPWADLVRVVDELLAPLFRGCRVVDLALVSLLAGFGEEMLFRGVVQQGIADWIGAEHGVWVGLAVASLLFGLLHPITPSYAVLAGLIGLYLGALWIATDNLLVPITTHTLYDFCVLVYVVRIRLPRRQDDLAAKVR